MGERGNQTGVLADSTLAPTAALTAILRGGGLEGYEDALREGRGDCVGAGGVELRWCGVIARELVL